MNLPINPIELLRGLVAEVSYSTHEQAAVDYLVRQMHALGYDRAFRDDAGNAVGMIGNGARQIVLLGHIDTVPGVIPVEIRDGKLYGRGSVDAKGPLATFTAGAALAGAQPGWQIIVIGAVEEEYTTSKGAHYAATQYQPELCIIGEPSSWDRITLGYKGRVLLDYTRRRPLAHTARPEPNAIEQAVEFWNAVKTYAAQYNADKERAFDQLMPSLRAIHSSDDGFHEQAEMTLGFRLPVELPPDALKTALVPFADAAELRWRGEELAYRAEKNTPLARIFLNSIRDVGGKPSFVYKTGTSDMNVVAPIWNCPICAYGPGDSALDHTPEEHLPLADYEKAIQVITTVLRSLPTI
jgi:[amino group carrier protein]-lysine/ornithine hydrolase